MDNNFPASALLLGLCLFLGLLFAGIFIRQGILRSGAMQAGMTAHEYSDWMDDVRR